MNISLNDKVAGLLYGFAIGDALGIGTELMTRKMMGKKYPDGLTHYSQIIRDAHRSQWARGEWSNDTNYLLMLAESICDCGDIKPLDFSSRLRKWFLSDPEEVSTHLRWIFSQEDYADNPIEVSKRVWRDMKDDTTPSDCLSRALLAGIWNENVAENALFLCRITHPKPKCETASLIIANVANALMWDKKPMSYDELISIAQKSNSETVGLIETARHGEIKDFELDDLENCSLTKKALGATLWTLWHCKSPVETLTTVVNEGGDADTNAALAMGLAGLKYGIDAIDAEYIEGLVGRERIESMSNRLAELLKKRFMNK